MSRLFWLSNEQVERITPFFPKVRGVSRANDRKVPSGIIYVIKHGLQWTDAPAEYGPRKTLYNRFRRELLSNLVSKGSSCSGLILV